MTQIIATTPLLSDIGNSKAITAKAKSNFSSAFLFLPPEKRKAMQNVYAFFRVVDDVVDEEADPRRQRELLDAWRRELVATYKGTTIVPLLKDLRESIDRFQIPQNYFLTLLEGCELDITKKRYPTFAELEGYCYRVASMVGLVCMRIFEYESPTADEAAINLGLALQLTNIIRDVGVDWEKGRVYLPQEDLKRFGLTESDLQKGPDPKRWRELMEFEHERALSYYEKGMSEFKKDTTGKLLPARIMAEVYLRLLKKIRAKNYPVLNSRVRISFPEKMMILFSLFASHIARSWR